MTTLLVLILGAGTALAAGQGGRWQGLSSGNFAITYFMQQPGETLQIETLNLSPGADTVLHVHDYTDKSFVAGNDDVPGSYRSLVTVPPTSTERLLMLIVRAYLPNTAGTGTLRVTRFIGAWKFPEDFPIAFAGSVLNLPLLAEGGVVTTVQERLDVSDHVVLVVSGPPENSIVFNDDGGVAYASRAVLSTACEYPCQAVVGTYPGSVAGPVTVVYDDDAPVRDCDQDGLGDALERYLATEACIEDSDGDGLKDGVEVFGVDSSPAVKLPLYGAEPKVKDLFVELDWKAPATENKVTGAEAEQLAAYFAPEVKVHLDIGVRNTNLATATVWNDWGGALEGTTSGSCDGFTPSRTPYFHHGTIRPGDASVGVGTCFSAAHSQRMIAHELGHNFGLMHEGVGGPVGCLPNYRSLMNYAYMYDSSIAGFSRGQIAAVLDPRNLNELSGLGTTDPAILDPLGGIYWRYTKNAAGAIDWNRDGVYSSSTRGAPHLAYGNGGCGASAYRAHKLFTGLQPLLTRLDDKLFAIGRNAAGKLDYRTATTTAQSSPTSASNWSSAVTITGSRPSANRPSAASMTTPRGRELLLVYTDGSALVYHRWRKGVTQPDALQTVPGASVDGVTAAVADGSLIRVYGASAGRLRRWDYTPATDSWAVPVDELWTTGQAVMTSGIAVTAGYETTATGQKAAIFAVIPDTLTLVQLARLDTATMRWVRFAEAAAWTAGAPMATSPPSLAYVPYSPSDVTRGRLFLAYTASGGNNMLARLAMTEGTDARAGATVGRLKFLDTFLLRDAWTNIVGPASLFYEPNRDSNLRAALIFADGANQVEIYPFADGIVNATLRDYNDVAKISACLGTSLNGFCP